jgi:hypothetical protein
MSGCLLLLIPLCRRTYLTILKSADHALFKMVRYVLLRPLRPELDGQDVEAGDSKIWVLALEAISFEKAFCRCSP